MFWIFSIFMGDWDIFWKRNVRFYYSLMVIKFINNILRVSDFI